LNPAFAARECAIVHEHRRKDLGITPIPLHVGLAVLLFMRLLSSSPCKLHALIPVRRNERTMRSRIQDEATHLKPPQQIHGPLSNPPQKHRQILKRQRKEIKCISQWVRQNIKELEQFPYWPENVVEDCEGAAKDGKGGLEGGMHLPGVIVGLPEASDRDLSGHMLCSPSYSSWHGWMLEVCSIC
jgi:hypothetical protein